MAMSRTSAISNIDSTIAADWPIKDIVYVAIVGGVMFAALLEWILWLLAFLYCLVKVFQKANSGKDKWTVRFLCFLNTIFFVGMRLVFLPIMAVTLPLPSRIVQYFPEEMVSVLQWFAFWSFAGLLTIPWLFCVYQLVTHNLGRERKIKTVLDEHSAPKVVVIMPCYNEAPDILLRTVDSIVDCEYPPSCLHVFLSFDGDQENELYLNTIGKLGVPLTLGKYPKSIDVTYRRCRITVSRFPHGGKRSCQKRSFKLIDKTYAEYLRRNDNLFLLFIDSDCILDKACIQNFMYEMELKPGSQRNMLAMTGVITSTTIKNTLITMLQDMEYIHGQLFERSVESGCGAVTCLPGALTALRFSAFRKMSKFYFADKAEQADDLFDYAKCHLGEDRWLTHLFMIGAKRRYQIQMNTGAFCKTEAVQSFKSLLKQRRRWFLGFITNEVCMLTDVRLWKRYPILLIIRLGQNTIRTTGLLFFIMVISIISTSQKIANLPVGFIAVSLGLNWALMIYFGAKLGRYKIMMYPIMFIINPFMNWTYMVYGIFTAGQRTWGGPRADAGKADAKTTASEVIAKAEASGDDLNVVPETFRPLNETVTTPLMPSIHLVGRFSPAKELPGGYYRQGNDSGTLNSDMTRRDPESALSAVGARRDSSVDSFFSSTSSVRTPRRVESIFEQGDTLAYFAQQALQRPPGGVMFEAVRQTQRHAPPVSLENRRRGQRRRSPAPPVPDRSPSLVLGSDRYFEPSSRRPRTSIDSLRSDSSVSLHFPIPAHHQRQRSESRQKSMEQPLQRRSSAPPAPILHAHRAPGRRAQSRSGQSPLARQSFVRLALDGAADVSGMDVERECRRSRRMSSDDEGSQRRGRRRTPTTYGSDGRRKLSKRARAPGSRDGSQG